MGDVMTWNKRNEPYPDQRPGSSYCDDIDRRAERNERFFVGYIDEIPTASKQESWRDKARRLGIRAYSFDHYCDQIEAMEERDRHAQQIHEMESKLTDAELAGVEELTDVCCTMTGRRGDPVEFTEHRRRCGDSRGEWSCSSGYGCNR